MRLVPKLTAREQAVLDDARSRIEPDRWFRPADLDVKTRTGTRVVPRNIQAVLQRLEEFGLVESRSVYFEDHPSGPREYRLAPRRPA